MLKKTLGIALLMASLSVTAFAAIPKDSMHIGGLRPGMTIEQVTAMYGQPVDAKSQFKAERGMYYIAGGVIKGWKLMGQDAFEGYSVGGYKPAAGSNDVSVTGDIRLGMTTDEVSARLGQPDQVMSFSASSVEYWYNSVEPVNIGWRKNYTLYFVFSDGRLVEIGLNHRYA